MHGGFGVHIKGANGKYGDLGWVRLDQISGYAKGTTGVKNRQIAEVNEEGRELIVTGDGRILRQLEPGDGVIPNPITENLIKWGGFNPQSYFANLVDTTSAMPSLVNKEQNVTIEQHYDSLITVEGNVDRDMMNRLEDLTDNLYDAFTDRLAGDFRKIGGRIKK